MKKNFVINLTLLLTIVFLFGFKSEIYAQQNTEIKTKSDFWNHVQFGGGLGLGIGNGYTDIMVAPSAIYNFNSYVSAGISTQYSYVKQRDFYSANMYGGSLIALFNPIEELQISTELEQLRVNRTFNDTFGNNSQDFWNTSLFLGAGFRNENVTFGVRYNVLHRDRDNIYAEAFMPFVRIFF
ncbi:MULTISPECIES: hypothetical protein [unclassified Flavobacterium]|uniref:hypothetical protein n=1 Tax=unclassified Flavobacterium TaxID=196869 RepID=UPI0012922DF3|nr:MULTISPECIES: hypothetical protein [unclassified Flavobacterium]MQP51324.1 hypothetical protein [Flavobacterium sp. LMO9]MQP61447.1 hypothetical protein [Flavobacterium sp. LMO6]